MTNNLSRRRLLLGSAAFAGGTALGFAVPHVLLAASGDWGDLVGRIVYDGTPPERPRLKVDKDVDCCGKFDIRDEQIMVGPAGGLANVFVFVRTRKVDVCPELVESLPKQVKLDNRDCIFKPHCLTLWQAKQGLHIVNSDPIAQNVAFSPIGDAPANIVMAAVKDPKEPVTADWKFARPQVLPVKIACNYHPWESAHIFPRDNPYVAITGLDGAFRLPKLPVGKLEIQAWQEKAGYLDTSDWPKGRFEVTIKPGTNDVGTIRVPPALLEK